MRLLWFIGLIVYPVYFDTHLTFLLYLLITPYYGHSDPRTYGPSGN